MNILSCLFNLLPIKRNKIVFYTMSGTYGCNPKYICEEIIRRKLPYELVWITDKSREEGDFPASVRLVSSGIRAAWERSTCRVLIHNTRKAFFSEGFKKKMGQVYIQTWHGSYGIKKMEADCQAVLSSKYLKRSKIDSKNIDYLISCGTWASKIFERSFYCSSDVIHEIGLPRNDIFFKDSKRYKEKVRKLYRLTPDTKIALYAPTFRDDRNVDCYDIDYKRLLCNLVDIFGGSWVLMFRLHPNVSYLFNQLSMQKTEIINAVNYPDMQELMSASDLMITDYSSCVFDFMLTKRPAFIYASDIEKYNTERGFYYPLEDTPFPIAVNNDELSTVIRNFEVDTYHKRVEQFLEKMGASDDGCAAGRCVDYIISCIG